VGGGGRSSLRFPGACKPKKPMVLMMVPGASLTEPILFSSLNGDSAKHEIREEGGEGEGCNIDHSPIPDTSQPGHTGFILSRE
jgi:hypothetical protein